MTNPDNTVGTNAGFNGRTTPNAFNDVLATYTGRGIINGWACSPKSGMTIQLGGNGSDRDVAIAEDNAGNKTTINNRTATPVEITLDGAPATNNRIDSIVAYVDNPQQGAGSTDVDFPSQVGIIAVKGTVAANPNAPTEAQIRTAITADGATGASAYYVVLANITVGTGVTTIGSGVIAQGDRAPLNTTNIANKSIYGVQLADATVGSDKLTTSAVYTHNINDGAVTSAKIDWTTFIPRYYTSTFDNTVFAANGSYTYAHLTIAEAGTYLVHAGISCWHDSAVRRGYAIQVTAGSGTTIIYNPSIQQYGTTSSGDTISINTIALVKCTAGATINGTFKVMDASGSAHSGGNPILLAWRIGSSS